MRLAPLAALAMFLTLPCAAQIYKWTDSTGKVHYSDAPPADGRKQEQLKIEVQSFGGPPVIERAPDFFRPKPGADAARNTQLVMYATSWCGYCRQARAYLAQKNVSYREIDIEATPANQREFKSYGGKGVPFFVSGDRTMRGFSADAMERFLARR